MTLGDRRIGTRPGDRHGGAHRPRQDRAGPGPDRGRHRPAPGREAARDHDRPGLRRARPRRPTGWPWSTSRATSGSSATCSPGASGLDLALLVVAADDSVMPQTREHLEILRLLGLSGGRGRPDQVRPGRRRLARPGRGRRPGAGRRDVPRRRPRSSGPRRRPGEGIDDLEASLGRLCDSAPTGDDPGLFRMAIDRSFTVAGHGTVVTGTVASGEVAVGDDLEWLPEGRTVRVRGLHRHDRPVERVGRGARAAINLVGVHHAEVRRGQELAAPGYLVASRVLSVEVRASRRGRRGRSATGPLPAPPRARRRSRRRSRCSTATSPAPGRDRLGPALPGRAGRGRPRPAVRAPRGEPAGDPRRRPGPPARRRRRIRRRDRAGDRPARPARARPTRRRGSPPRLARSGLAPWTDRTLCREAGRRRSARSARRSTRLAASGALVELPIGPEAVGPGPGRGRRRPGRPGPPGPRPAPRGRARGTRRSPAPTSRLELARPGERRPRRRP